MTRSRRSAAALLLAAMLFCGCFAAFTVGSRADNEPSAPTLYINDEVWYNTGLYSAQIRKSVCVPLTMFEQIKGITVTFYNNNTAMVYRDDTHFISFDFNKNSAMTPSNERFAYTTFLVDNVRYVPMVTICHHLGLTQETYSSEIDGSLSVRICDGSQTKTFVELLERYNPGALYAIPVTQPPETTYFDPVENAVFLGIDGIGSAERHTALLALLEEYAISATFFVTPDDVQAKPELVLSLIARGHAIGLLIDEFGALDALAAANETLAARFHMTTRLVRVRGELGEHIDRDLQAAGYSRWGSHIDLGESETDVRTALTAFRGALTEEGHIILRADPDGFNTVGYLREFFNSAKGKRIFLPITPAYVVPVN